MKDKYPASWLPTATELALIAVQLYPANEDKPADSVIIMEAFRLWEACHDLLKTKREER